GGVTAGVLNVVLHALEEAGKGELVLETVSRAMELGAAVNTGTFRCAIKACGAALDHKGVDLWLKKMAQQGLGADLVSWNLALCSLSAAGLWRRTYSTLRAMEEAGVVPDSFSYHMVLRACSAGVDTREDGTGGILIDEGDNKDVNIEDQASSNNWSSGPSVENAPPAAAGETVAAGETAAATVATAELPETCG
ncbi:unnamed protein product, partial [Discosporangium mesarthrocarpum]